MIVTIMDHGNQTFGSARAAFEKSNGGHVVVGGGGKLSKSSSSPKKPRSYSYGAKTLSQDAAAVAAVYNSPPPPTRRNSTLAVRPTEPILIEPESPKDWRSRLKKSKTVAPQEHNNNGVVLSKSALVSPTSPSPSNTLKSPAEIITNGNNHHRHHHHQQQQLSKKSPASARRKIAKLKNEEQLNREILNVEMEIRRAEEGKQQDKRKNKEILEIPVSSPKSTLVVEEETLSAVLPKGNKSPPLPDTITVQEKRKNALVTPIQAVVRGFLQRKKFVFILEHARKEKELLQRLAEIQNQTQRDLRALEEKVVNYKNEISARAKAKKEKYKDRYDAIQRQREDMDKIKKENAHFRERNEILKKNCRNLRINNLRLEKSIASQEEYAANLKEHHNRCVKDNQRLIDVEKGYRKKVLELRASLQTRTAYAVTEFRTKNRYRETVRKFFKMVEKCQDDALNFKIMDIQDNFELLEKKNAGSTIPFPIPQGEDALLIDSDDDDSDSSFWDTPITNNKAKVKVSSSPSPMAEVPYLDNLDLKAKKSTKDSKPIKNGTKISASKSSAKASSSVKKAKGKRQPSGSSSDSSSSSSSSSSSDSCPKRPPPPPRRLEKEPSVRFIKPTPRSKRGIGGPKDSLENSDSNNSNTEERKNGSNSQPLSRSSVPKACSSDSDDVPAKRSSSSIADSDSSDSETRFNRNPIQQKHSLFDAAAKLTGGSPPKPVVVRKRVESSDESDGWSSGNSDSEASE